MKYERLTTKDNTHRPYPLDCFSCYNKNCNGCELNIRMLERLAELEDMIESGKLVEVPDNNTKYAVVEFYAQKSRNCPLGVLSYHYSGIDSRGIPIKCYEWVAGNFMVIEDNFNTREEAEKKRQELLRGRK